MLRGNILNWLKTVRAIGPLANSLRGLAEQIHTYTGAGSLQVFDWALMQHPNTGRVSAPVSGNDVATCSLKGWTAKLLSVSVNLSNNICICICILIYSIPEVSRSARNHLLPHFLCSVVLFNVLLLLGIHIKSEMRATCKGYWSVQSTPTPTSVGPPLSSEQRLANISALVWLTAEIYWTKIVFM